MTLAWAHRDRTQQTAYLVPQDEGDIGPEPGVSYTVRIKDRNDALVRTDANLKRLGATVGLSVKDRDLTTPPASPTDGDRYIVPAAATGAWAGKANQIAVRIEGAWEFHPPKVGWLCYIEDEAKLSAYKPAGWSAGIAI